MVFIKGVPRRGQVTLFIIIAIVLVAGISLFFILKNNLSGASSLDKEIQPIYNAYLSCIESSLKEGVNLMGYQGGYIELPEFVPGSLYRPTSSQLDFFGQPIAYWYYISGNNIIHEQVPTKKGMEEELGKYVSERLDSCNLKGYSLSGYDAYIGPGEVLIDISEGTVEARVINNFNVYTENETYIINTHQVSINSKLGKFYDLALKTYDHEKETNFLESYALDALWTSSPVIGVNFTCEPLIFVDEIIIENLMDSLSVNIASMKLKGTYYDLSNELNKYFVVDMGESVEEDVMFRYSKDWPTRVDIEGDRIITPIGLQQGLEILGFCYVPYHLVYDVDFPVLIQFFDDDFIFQFPINVVLQNNGLLNVSKSEVNYNLNDEICSNLNNHLKVYTYDYSLNPVETRLQFKCMSSLCELGSTSNLGVDAIYDGEIPGCIGGRVIASAEGYLQSEFIINSLDDTTANILLKKLYELDLDLESEELSVISFEGEDYSTTINYPTQKSIKLVEGNYNVSIITYSDTMIKLSEVPDEICVDVPVCAAGDLFGVTKEQCYTIENPQTEINMAVVGGGSLDNYYITESELKGGSTLSFDVDLFEIPTSIEKLQQNYLLLESSKLGVGVY
jgi:hypothetical protein